MEYTIHDIPKGARIFGMEGIHDGLSFIIECCKDYPWKTEE